MYIQARLGSQLVSPRQDHPNSVRRRANVGQLQGQFVVARDEKYARSWKQKVQDVVHYMRQFLVIYRKVNKMNKRLAPRHQPMYITVIKASGYHNIMAG